MLLRAADIRSGRPLARLGNRPVPAPASRSFGNRVRAQPERPFMPRGIAFAHPRPTFDRERSAAPAAGKAQGHAFLAAGTPQRMPSAPFRGSIIKHAREKVNLHHSTAALPLVFATLPAVELREKAQKAVSFASFRTNLPIGLARWEKICYNIYVCLMRSRVRGRNGRTKTPREPKSNPQYRETARKNRRPLPARPPRRRGADGIADGFGGKGG